MNKITNHTEEELNDLSKSWATIFICAILIGVTCSEFGERLLHLF